MFSRTLKLTIVVLAIFAMDLAAGDEAKDKVAPPPAEQIPSSPAKILKEQIPTMPAKVVREQIPTMPATFAGLTKQKLPPSAFPDSFNVLPCLLGTAKTACRDHLVLHSGPGDLAIRQGDWVLIPRPSAAKNNKKVDELYNLARDVSQTTNVAARNPEIVRQLTVLLNKIRESDGSR